MSQRLLQWVTLHTYLANQIEPQRCLSKLNLVYCRRMFARNIKHLSLSHVLVWKSTIESQEGNKALAFCFRGNEGVLQPVWSSEKMPAAICKFIVTFYRHCRFPHCSLYYTIVLYRFMFCFFIWMNYFSSVCCGRIKRRAFTEASAGLALAPRKD